MKKIPLSKGQFALVDDDDFDAVSALKWHWSYGYAVHTEYLGGGRSKPRYKSLRMHRFIMDAINGMDVDHINHNPLDNRRSNLRVCTRGQNRSNSLKRKGVSRYKGVSWAKARGRWVAQIRKDGKCHEIIATTDEREAALYYDIAAQLFHGHYACVNGV